VAAIVITCPGGQNT